MGLCQTIRAIELALHLTRAGMLDKPAFKTSANSSLKRQHAANTRVLPNTRATLSRQPETCATMLTPGASQFLLLAISCVKSAAGYCLAWACKVLLSCCSVSASINAQRHLLVGKGSLPGRTYAKTFKAPFMTLSMDLNPSCWNPRHEV